MTQLLMLPRDLQDIANFTTTVANGSRSHVRLVFGYSLKVLTGWPGKMDATGNSGAMVAQLDFP
ncbi:hypothetical protein [Cypionkella sp.]|uniref:hypothetical protein n=1 Tax=Cypionkella sp. TaxID=2811411 RepID=UPI00262AA8FE|nr:hypothetical protein [Cypionkella sp.]